MDKTQTFASYNRDKVSNFLSPYERISLRSIDNEETYQVNYYLPSALYRSTCLFLPIIILIVLPNPLYVKVIGVVLGAVIIPASLLIFHLFVSVPLQGRMIRFHYEKASMNFSIPYLQLKIPHADIIEFIVISGRHNGDEFRSGNLFINELSVVFKEHDTVKRVPLFLSNKKKTIKVAEKLSDYTGLRYHIKRV